MTQMQPDTPAVPPPLSGMWHVHLSEGTHGPLSKEGVIALIAGGRIGRATFVWGPQSTQWAPAASFPEFTGMKFADLPVHEMVGAGLLGQIRYVRHEAIALFAAYLCCMGLASSAGYTLHTGKEPIFQFSDVAIILLMAGLFAVACLIRRWRAFMNLPGIYLLLAWIGGFGLIVLMVGMIAFFVAGMIIGIPPQQ